MHLIDIFAGYWLFLQYLLYVTVIIITLSSLDDLFIDIYYWIRRIYRKFFVYNVHKPFQLNDLYKKEEKPLAIMVPTWNEAGVIRRMVTLAISITEYHNYHVFIGTYPNDKETQAEVDELVHHHQNVHKVVTHNPGPTNKSDCLNNIVEQIFTFEKTHNIQFEAYVFHDAEDVTHPLELKLFNYLIDKNDLIQIPVVPFERKWYEFSGGHYEDEFAEIHGKDLLVRENMLGFVPSAGVGTAINRKALNKLIELHKGQPFDLETLTEDYNMGFELFNEKMKLIFVRVPVESEELTTNILGKPVIKKKTTYIAVREFFPNTFRASVRQKTRWLIGIVFQGWSAIGWQKGASLRYFLYRDRKSIVTNLANVFAYFLVINVIGMMLYAKFTKDTWWFPPLIEEGGFIWWLLILNAFFFFNRLLHRAYFSGRIYGWKAALLSVPRVVWGNIINFVSMIKAGKTVLVHSISGEKIGWDKTTHDFLPGEVTFNKRLGDLLIESNTVSDEMLKQALSIQKVNGKMLGEILIGMHLTTEEKIAQAIALQKDLEYINIDASDIDTQSMKKIDRLFLLEHNIVTLKTVESNRQDLATSDQLNTPTEKNISHVLNKEVKVYIAKSSIIDKTLYLLFDDLNKIEFSQLKTILIKKMIPRSEIEKIITFKNENNISLIESAQHFEYLPTDQIQRIK